MPINTFMTTASIHPLQRIVEHRKPHVAAVTRRADIGVAADASRPGMMDGVARRVGAEALHDLEHAAGVIGLFQHDARGGDALLDARRRVDHVGEARRPGELAVDEGRHEPHQLAAITRRSVGGRREQAAFGEIGLDRHLIAHDVFLRRH